VIRRIGASFLRALLWLLGFWFLAVALTVIQWAAIMYGVSGIGSPIGSLNWLWYPIAASYLLGMLMFIVSLVAGLARRS
jgi:hypothetical protein